LSAGETRGINLDVFHLRGQFNVTHRCQFSASDCKTILKHAKFPGDGLRRQRMIAGDHHGFDTGLAAFLDRGLRLRTGWVDHAG
jgi:hypothetical protein